MTSEEPRRLGLELRLDVQPIEGRLYDQAGSAGLDRPFSGWLGLLSAIEAARSIPPQALESQKAREEGR